MQTRLPSGTPHPGSTTSTQKLVFPTISTWLLEKVCGNGLRDSSRPRSTTAASSMLHRFQHSRQPAMWTAKWQHPALLPSPPRLGLARRPSVARRTRRWPSSTRSRSALVANLPQLWPLGIPKSPLCPLDLRCGNLRESYPLPWGTFPPHRSLLPRHQCLPMCRPVLTLMAMQGGCREGLCLHNHLHPCRHLRHHRRRRRLLLVSASVLEELSALGLRHDHSCHRLLGRPRLRGDRHPWRRSHLKPLRDKLHHHLPFPQRSRPRRPGDVSFEEDFAW
mmetsp:Transcript_22258/g.64701  ORF Transcript_22258/g.64701 Transcript_22258/m.64701 type:complete len:277 (+) Transcript_22258:613-1443(+)